MKFRAGPGIAWAALLGALLTSTAAAEEPPLSLKLSRELELPAQRPAPPGTAPAPRAAPGPQRIEIGGEREPRGALFLRADRLEGDERRITAIGNVELRTRRETVLADRLSYDTASETVYGDGNVVLRRGLDWNTGSQLQYKRDTEVGFFRAPRFFVKEANAHGD